jgi:hypothetical protein
MTTFTTQHRQDAQRDGKCQHCEDGCIACDARVLLIQEVMKIGDALGLKTISSDYNAFEVMQVIRQLIDASLLASKPMKKRPLPAENVYKLAEQYIRLFDNGGIVPDVMGALEFARAIERAHGIGE